ncbi:hypothetical protein LTR50_003795 [Elasticomyces elasticus]|nr:hypothetical protein LTR50_003795 [Elasticomyces elasticus]
MDTRTLRSYRHYNQSSNHRYYFSDPTSAYRSARFVTISLLATNAVVFAAWQYAQFTHNRRLRNFVEDNTLLSLPAWHAGKWWTLVTSAFAHHDLTHFAFNMVALYTFCRNLSSIPGFGGIRLLGLALGSGVAGSTFFLYQQSHKAPTERSPLVASAVLDQFQRAPRQVAALGASGIVCGVSAAAACILPSTKMLIFPLPVPIPLWLGVVGYAAVDAYYIDQRDARIAHAGHLGGLAFGLAYYLGFLTRFGGVWTPTR